MLQWIIIEQNLPVLAIGIDGKRSTNIEVCIMILHVSSSDLHKLYQ